MDSRSAEARRVFVDRWRGLRRAVAAESGVEIRRGGWALLAVAFCCGLALGAGDRPGDGR